MALVRKLEVGLIFFESKGFLNHLLQPSLMTQLVFLFVAAPGSWTSSSYNIEHIVADSNSGNQNGWLRFIFFKESLPFWVIFLEIFILMTRQSKSIALEERNI